MSPTYMRETLGFSSLCCRTVIVCVPPARRARDKQLDTVFNTYKPSSPSTGIDQVWSDSVSGRRARLHFHSRYGSTRHGTTASHSRSAARRHRSRDRAAYVDFRLPEKALQLNQRLGRQRKKYGFIRYECCHLFICLVPLLNNEILFYDILPLIQGRVYVHMIVVAARAIRNDGPVDCARRLVRYNTRLRNCLAQNRDGTYDRDTGASTIIQSITKTYGARRSSSSHRAVSSARQLQTT
jgi:hypothetical protein